MSPEEALALIRGGESATVELKPESEYQTTLAEALAALANSAAGTPATIFVGVQDQPIVIRGISDLKAVTDRLYSAARQVHPPLHDLITVEPIRIEERTVVAAHVPAQVPGVYHVAGRYLARRGTQNLPLTPQELLRLLHERGIYAYEDQAAPGATLADLDPARLAWYREQRAAKRLSPLDTPDDEELLEKLGLLAPGGVPTVAAILFFGREPQRFFPHMVIRAARFLTEWTGDFHDQEEIGGTVPEMIDRANAFVQRNTPHGAQIVGTQRVPTAAYPDVAVREAIANAVAHRDLAITGATIRVFVFSNRIEIDSPGGLLPGLTVENMARLTRLRNRRLADLLYHTGYIERQGTGIRRMIAALLAAGQPAPVIENFGESLFVTLLAAAPTPANVAPPPTAELPPPAPVATPAHTAALNLRERRLLAYLRDKGAITRVEYEAYFSVGTRTAKRDLKHLQDLGLIAHRGSSTASYYVLVEA
jgi:ATP-dependent DNA helicase RecG